MFGSIIRLGGNACKMFAGIPESSGAFSKCLRAFRNHPERLQKVCGHCGIIRSVFKKFAGTAEPSGVFSKSLRALRNHPERLQKVCGHCGTFRTVKLSIINNHLATNDVHALLDAIDVLTLEVEYLRRSDIGIDV